MLPEAITRFPELSAVTPHEFKLAAVAAPPSPTGPKACVPAGVVSRLDPGLISRTAPALRVASAMSRCPWAKATSHGDRATLVPLAGPPTPPATVEIIPPAAWPTADGAPAPPRRAAATACPPANSVADASTATIRASVLRPGPPVPPSRAPPIRPSKVSTPYKAHYRRREQGGP